MSQKFGTRREKAKEETRRIILESAYTLFEEKGYEKATMRELAARAGVGLGTIFQHFSNKPALLIATFYEEMRPEVETALATAPDKGLKAQLLHLIRHIFGFYARRIRLSRVLIKEILFLEGESAENIKQLESEYLERLNILFTAAAARGELHEAVDIPDAVTAFWSYYSCILIEEINAPTFDINGRVEQLGRLIDQLFNGIGRSSG
ncbi:MAG: TetR/AcrR family transcriptional regulator [Desulfobacteraceae bacterium]|nr:TetR/AcrR family transcriptional regulator [Desulfobacteraceae bacterium]